jgi:DNA modification methylase
MGVSLEISRLKPNPRNARTHSKRQIRQVADSIKEFGFLVPVIVDETSTILAGHARYAAAKLLGLSELSAVVVEGLSPGKKRALMLADNKITENAGWDREVLALELSELSEILLEDKLDMSITGFAAAEIDLLVDDHQGGASHPVDDIDPNLITTKSTTVPGDLWLLGRHRLLCGDARTSVDVQRLIDGELASMAFLDPPYNVQIKSVVGRGKIKHKEFAMASGELSSPQFTAFLAETFDQAASASKNGAVHYICMDWRHLRELFDAGAKIFGEPLNVAVWVKSNAGQGSFYRSQHEHIGVFRVGDQQHLNNVELGRYGRNRSNVWHYAGANAFRAGRMEDLEAHPTVKPVALVSDAIKDCTRQHDIVLDTFCGSGTTILAAERTGRRAYALDIEPKFIDLAIRRWQAFTRKDAILAGSDQCFSDIEQERLQTPDLESGHG